MFLWTFFSEVAKAIRLETYMSWIELCFVLFVLVWPLVFFQAIALSIISNIRWKWPRRTLELLVSVAILSPYLLICASSTFSWFLYKPQRPAKWVSQTSMMCCIMLALISYAFIWKKTKER